MDLAEVDESTLSKNLNKGDYAMEWIISANSNIYDHKQAFKELLYVDWMQNANYTVGDKVFIYVTKPIQSVKYITEVIAINLKYSEILNDGEYWVNKEKYRKRLKNGNYVRLRLIKEIFNDNLSLEGLHNNGLVGNLQGPRKLEDEDGNLYSWAKYIYEIVCDDLKGSWENTVNYIFSDPEFNKIFHKSIVLDRSYYDLFFDSKNIHLVARNTSRKSVEIYIQDNIPLYHFALKNIGILKNNIEEDFDVYSVAEEKNMKHRKLVLYYDGKTETLYEDWLVKTCLILVENVHELEMKLLSITKRKNNRIDDNVNESISQFRKFPLEFKYSDEILLAPERYEKNGVSIYKRDRQRSINALVHANFRCEVNNEHYCFIRKNSGKPYTEAHHLIPLAFQDEFEYSLDVEENIVSLCSNCHNEIHYGENAKELLEALYNERCSLLEGKKIFVSLEQLFSYYGIMNNRK